MTNLKELSSPIRMYWDLDSNAGVAERDCRRIAGEIAGNKFLALQVSERSSCGISRSCLAVLDVLKDKNVALSLALPLSPDTAPDVGVLRSFPIRLLLISADSINSLPRIPRIKEQLDGKPSLGIAFPVNRSNFTDLTRVLQFCIDNRIEKLVLPMQRLIDGEKAFLFSAEERRDLCVRLGAAARPASLKIIIHDPFLWRAFFPSAAFPYGGCQAANTMVYISPGADVYPCPALPVRIGNLKQSSLRDVLASDEKKEIRKKILARPVQCEGCADEKLCKGGCRGRAYVLGNSFSHHDPACS